MKFHVVVTSRDSLQILTSKIQDGYRTAPQIFYLSGESNKFGTGSIYSSVDSKIAGYPRRGIINRLNSKQLS